MNAPRPTPFDWKEVYEVDRLLARLDERGLQLTLAGDVVTGYSLVLARGRVENLDAEDRALVEKHRLAIGRRLRDAQRRVANGGACYPAFGDRRAAIRRVVSSPAWAQPGGLSPCSVCRKGTIWARAGVALHPFCVPEGEA